MATFDLLGFRMPVDVGDQQNLNQRNGQVEEMAFHDGMGVTVRTDTSIAKVVLTAPLALTTPGEP
jgi:hypothetical protein